MPHIQLVEADTPGLGDLMAAVDQAVASGARIVTMSWGGPESAAELAADTHFARPGVEFFASSGDSGYGASYPAASGLVTAVGGTSLKIGAAGLIGETAWAGSGSGCSRYEAKPVWQHDSLCARRSVADLAAVADPATGAAIYSSVSSNGPGWFVVGGTSLAAPLVAGMAASNLAGSQSAFMTKLYSPAGAVHLRDIISGRNGRCTNYLCQAGLNYDGPTGMGSPIGLEAL